MNVSIDISDADIEVAESLMKYRFDKKRREVLKCNTSHDIQAGPGSGKTTLLVAKLAILSSKWKWQDRGICVLSHTNVARLEIEKRLTYHVTAHKLLNFPHFVGTIQVFVDQFLAIPYLRDQGIEISMVDDDRFADVAERKARFKMKTLSPLLKYRRNGWDIVKQLRYEGADRILSSAEGKIPVGKQTSTYKTLEELKQAICESGVFRFDDMYAYAEAYIKKYPRLIEIIQMRFPFVFVDEMQDTYEKQDKLIKEIFSERCMLQRYGDINQRIFQEETDDEDETSFPMPNCIELPDCKRFCFPIASFASPLTAMKEQTLIGNPERCSKRHTIFLFEKTSINRVLPAFGDLLLEEYQTGFPEDFVAKAIGFRKSGTDSTKVPYSIKDYWGEFQPEFTVKSPCFNSLVDFVRKARGVREEEKECRNPYNILEEGVLQFLHRQAALDDAGVRFNKARLVETLEKRGLIEDFQKLLLDLCLSRSPLDSKYWDSVTTTLGNLMKPWIGERLTSEASEFLTWSDKIVQPRQGMARPEKDRFNFYHHERPNDHVNIELTTIHSVKGETHTATLVLETYFKKTYDLQKLLPFFKGNGDREQFKKEKILLGHARRIFVAMTRPKELLCLAMHKDHLEKGDIDSLNTLGWNFVDVTTK